jgi:hypothetical protein
MHPTIHSTQTLPSRLKEERMATINHAPGDVVRVYATVVNSDGQEGRGHDYVLAYFWSAENAKAYGKGKDVMGSDGKVKEYKAVIDGQMRLWVGEPTLVLDSTEDAEREEALDKLKEARLTKREMELLGVKL